MAKTRESEHNQDSIARRVEALAMESLLEQEPDERKWRESLHELSGAAASAGGTAVAAIARELAETLDGSEVRSTIAAGILQLEKAVESWKTSGATWEIAPANEPASLLQDPELLTDFIVESREHLDSVEGRLLEIERDPGNRDAIHSIFRSFHTVKGLAGFLDLQRIREVSHEVETVLDHVRESRLSMTPEVVDMILASLDYLNGCLRALEGPEGAGATLGDNSTLLGKIRNVSAQPANPGTAIPEQREAKPADEPVRGEPVAAAVPEANPGTRSGSRSVKIDTEKLDYMVDMVGEMVIAQSLIRYDPDLHLQSQPRLARNLSQLARITNEVQRTAMSMRMVPIAGLFQKMARLVRDLARKSGKSAIFESVGDEVELDRHIVEELADPLMHMIRNAVDHGIEPAAERVASGKEPSAMVKLTAMHQAGQIIIQVADDGRGLSRDKILAKARAQGFIGPTADPADSEVFNLIFHPGFSTATQVSDVSGRGVGMDVVRRQIQKLRGTVDIQTKAGQGTTFSLKLPLTLAIIEGLIVAVGGHRYIIPIFSVKELFRPNADTIFTVENRSEMVLVRDRLVPVVRLYDRFGVQSQTTDARSAVFVLAESDTRLFCLMVDSVIGKQEVVIKSLGTMFQAVRGIAGGAILGDGHVALILDPMALFGGVRERVR